MATLSHGLSYDVERVRKDFPIFERQVHDRPLIYLDSGNTSQKPRQVLDALEGYYERYTANVARAVHTLGEEATAAYEEARDKVAAFLGAPDRDEIVFTKNISEALNLVAYSFGPHATDPRFRVGPGDEVVVTEMEHHSNIVPWQLLCQRTGATLRWFGLTDDGRLELANIDKLITERTKVVAFVHQSNMLGTLNPVATIVERAREVGALTVLDAAQSVPHRPVDVGELGVDFLGFTGHKALGPTGVGVLWGCGELLSAMTPFLGGGEMIETVTMERTTYKGPPHKFEAGTPPIAQAIGLGAAVDYLSEIGMPAVEAHEHALTTYALGALQQVEGLRVIGPTEPTSRGSAISFALGDVHPHDVAQLLDEFGVAVRAGHHCARPACMRYGVPATTRASFHLYTTQEEVDALVSGLEHVKEFFG
ncbi:MAG: cysteine desulfurase [Streptosporangiaceae bacterium]